MSQLTLKIEGLKTSLRDQKPFSLLSIDQLNQLFDNSAITGCKIGDNVIHPDKISDKIYLVIRGEVRYLFEDKNVGTVSTIDKRGPGQLLGWLSLFRGEPGEWITASTDLILLALDAKVFISIVFQNNKFRRFFQSQLSVFEVYNVIYRISSSNPKPGANWLNKAKNFIPHSILHSIECGQSLQSLFADQYQEYDWFMSSAGISDFPVGIKIRKDNCLANSSFPLDTCRILGIKKSILSQVQYIPETFESLAQKSKVSAFNTSLSDLGIVEPDSDAPQYPFVRASNQLMAYVASIEMICLYHNVPFRKEVVVKILEDYKLRNKNITLDTLGGILELLGFSCQVDNTKLALAGNIEPPFIISREDKTYVVYKVAKDLFTLADPRKKIFTVSVNDFYEKDNQDFKFLLPRSSSSTPERNFGLNWFTPLILKYKKSLALVFFSSLFAQLFGLAIPLIIQQIIDKVLAQGNLSSLNILGGLMIFLALFQGVLNVLRTYIFVDTTDRIDLTLGSAVISRLLSLPLKFFEKRPVGELSQRLGELNTIRSFLTGTALSSVMSIIFALMYLVVMFVYSPLLTAVALSTTPIYILIVVIVAPIYKSLIRNRAVQQARTQSHLIEVLGGIQTVKAQHFEQTARWKWQERYSKFVNDGFKAVAVGSSAGEVGNFLNQLSGLLVLWVGMWLVLEGELTLGMLIAFRIIAGNVTGPLLQLSTLYQGYQGVQLSLERLSDIIDSPAEFVPSDNLKQISLPPVSGSIKFENVSFRFGKTGPMQVNRVDLDVEAGSFVGIVGQSGSGKSTLMKLLPRLYDLENGRILIDGYDISKVNLSSLRRQVGIVPQDSLLFEGSIADNISMNDPDADNNEIIESAKIACAHDFIMTLPKGYATTISEKGNNLSGGQRQRIAVARTILSNPNLLILDEATSALDYATEKQLCINLQQWAKNKTVFFITHRLATIKQSDKIILMSDGSLIEQGSHDELMSKAQMYYTLYIQQDN